MSETTTTTDISSIFSGDVTNEELLQEINIAIRKVMAGGQSYKIGTRSLTRADLGDLLQMRKEIKAEIAADGESSLLDNTYVAYFDGR